MNLSFAGLKQRLFSNQYFCGNVVLKSQPTYATYDAFNLAGEKLANVLT